MATGTEWEAARCPGGHPLRRRKAFPGPCDGCGAAVYAGSFVMDCRQCNWYLCETCLPPERRESPGCSCLVSAGLAGLAAKVSKDYSNFKEFCNELETYVVDRVLQDCPDSLRHMVLEEDVGRGGATAAATSPPAKSPGE